MSHLHFQFLFLLIIFLPNVLARSSNIMFNRSGDSGHPCPISGLRGKEFSILPFI